MSYTVLDPTAEQAPPEIRPAPRPATLAGLTVGFISNGKEGTKGFFGHLDTALRIMLGEVTKAQPSLIDGYGGRLLLLNPDTQHSSGSAAVDEQGDQR